MKLARQLAEDRALRDAALALFRADLRFIRNDLDRRGIGERMADRLGDGARELAEDAVDYAEDHKSVVAAVLAALVLWFARVPILGAIGELFDGDEDAPEPKPKPRRSTKKGKKASGGRR